MHLIKTSLQFGVKRSPDRQPRRLSGRKHFAS
jgi:hypothetical protein